MPGRDGQHLPEPEPGRPLQPADRCAGGQPGPLPPGPCRPQAVGADVAVPVDPVGDRPQVRRPVGHQAGPAPGDGHLLQPDRPGGLLHLADLAVGERPEQELLAGQDLASHHLPAANHGGPRDERDRGQRVAQDAQSLRPVLLPVRLLAVAEPHPPGAPLGQVVEPGVGQAVLVELHQLRFQVREAARQREIGGERRGGDVHALRVLRVDLLRAGDDGLVPPDHLHVVLDDVQVVVAAAERVVDDLVVGVVEPADLAVAGYVVGAAEQQADPGRALRDRLKLADQRRQAARVVDHDDVVAFRHEQHGIDRVDEIDRELVPHDRVQHPTGTPANVLHLWHYFPWSCWSALCSGQA